MNQILSLCRLFYDSTFVPLHVLEANSIVLGLPYDEPAHALPSRIMERLIENPASVSYLNTRDFIYFGLIKQTDSNVKIILGPVISTPVSKRTVINYIQEAEIQNANEQRVQEFFQSLPNLSLNQFLSTLSFFNQLLNNSELSIQELLEINGSETEYSQKAAYEHSADIYKAKEEQSFHNTYYFELTLLNLVKNGDFTALEQLFKAVPSLKEGLIAGDSIRQARNILIVNTTLVTRQSILGGLDIETAYELSDVYIREAEKIHNVPALYRLMYSMVMDFTKRVARSRIPENIPMEIRKCINYIRNNTNETLTVAAAAEITGMSRTYISRLFKKTMGINMNDFINNCKIEDAKNLLEFTDKSLSEISSYLCFSSQSYFQNVFKKCTGITPNKYRKMNQLNEN